MSVGAEPVIRRLLGVGPGMAPELDGRVVLERIPETARELTGSRYAALGILNERRDGLEHFVTAGVDHPTRRAIGHPPRGRGVLGVLIGYPQPVRLRDVRQHPISYGFPAGHPVMRSFLGVPILMHGQVWGNLYMTEKAVGEFTETDEQAAVDLAEWAAIAFDRLGRESRIG